MGKPPYNVVMVAGKNSFLADGKHVVCSSGSFDTKKYYCKGLYNSYSKDCPCAKSFLEKKKNSKSECKVIGDFYEVPVNDNVEILSVDNLPPCHVDEGYINIPIVFVKAGFDAKMVLAYLKQKRNISIPATADHFNIISFPTIGISWILFIKDLKREKERFIGKLVSKEYGLRFRIWRHK